MNYFDLDFSITQVNAISTLGLAHVGDAVYELMVRSRLCSLGHTAVDELHRLTVATVNATAQAKVAAKLQPLLSEEELYIYKRGRNTKVYSVPHGAGLAKYHAATGLEALFGWLYLQGRTQRLNQLFDAAMED